MKKIKYILASLLAITSLAAHATLRMPDITVTKITTTGVTSNVGFKVKDSNEWLKADAGKWTVTSTDTPVQGAIGEKDYSGFFFNANSTSNNQTIGIYDITYALADINDPANGIVVDPTTTGGTLLVKRRIGEIVIPGTPGIEKPEFTVSTNYFVIKGNNDLYVIIYKGKVYGTSDIEKATKFETYLLANVNHNVSCVQTALAATCTAGGHNAVYQCSICQKYFKEETCETETTITDEETEALGHNYQVVKDENGKATWTWAEDYSTATLHVVCTNDAEHNDNKKTTDITSAVTTQPTTEAKGVLTFTATATYNEVEYTGTTTQALEKKAELTAGTQLTDGSWTLYNADAGSNMADITVTPGTSSSPTVANILLQSTSETPITVQTSIIATAYTTVNIHTIGNVAAIIKGDLTANQHGTLNINGVSVSGKIDGNGTIKMDNANVAGYLDLSYGANVTINGGSVDASSGEAPAIIANNADVNISGGTFKAKEGIPAFLKSGAGSITAAEGKTFWHGGVAYNDPFADITPNNAPARGNGPRKATSVDYYYSQLSSYTVCDATHSDANFAGQKPFGSSELTGVYVCDNGCGTTKVAATPTYTREMANLWGTIVLPFAITYSKSNDNNKLYKLTAAAVNGDQGTLTFTEYDDNAAIPAGTPMAVKAFGDMNSSEKYVISFTAGSNSVSKTITPTAAVDGLTMKGTYAETSIGGTVGNDIYFIAQGQFWRADVATSVSPFRAWFEGTPASGTGVKSLNIVVEDETDGINEIVNGKLSNGKLLENGRIVILKNGKKYNVNGQVIK